jgi:hypothetical protein
MRRCGAAAAAVRPQCMAASGKNMTEGATIGLGDGRWKGSLCSLCLIDLCVGAVLHVLQTLVYLCTS